MGNFSGFLDNHPNFPVTIDENEERNEESCQEVEYSVADSVLLGRPIGIRLAASVSDVDRDPITRKREEHSDEPRDRDADVGHPLPMVLPVEYRMNDLHVPLQGYEGQVSDGTVHSNPQSSFAFDEEAHERVLGSREVLLDQLPNVCDNQEHTRRTSR